MAWIASFGVVFAIAIGVRPWNQGRTAVAPQSDQPTLTGLVADPQLVDFGEVAWGERLTANVNLTNRFTNELKIGRVRSSCPCLHLELPAGELAASMSMPGRLVFDTTNEPNFGGNLRLTIDVFATDGTQLLTLRADVHVKPQVATR
jgi:hypothetical protein